MFFYCCCCCSALPPPPLHCNRRKQANPCKVTLEYENGVPSKVTAVVISTQHSKDVNLAKVKELCMPYIERSIPKNLLGSLDEKEIYINPTGNFVIGGPDGDSGLTGRKIIVDTYGGAAPHGGGAFSGKDPTKVDRSAAYASRYLAKNLSLIHI